MAREDAEAFDVTLGAPDDLAEVVECLGLKGFCVIDARDRAGLAQDALTEVQQLPGGRFKPPAASESARVADGLLGPEGTSRLAQLKSPDVSDADGTQLRALDQFVAELSFGLNEYLPVIGTDASSRTMGLLLETVVQEEGAAASTQEMTEEECSKWLRIFTLHRVMILFFLGPAKGTLELGLFGEDETAAGQRQSISTGPGVMVVLRPDVVSRRHTVESGRSVALACFSLTSRERPGPSEPPLAPYRDDLMMWIMERLKDLKNKEIEDESALDSVPREWVRAMNAEFSQGQQACIRASSCKLAGPLSFDPWGLSMEMSTGADFVIEVPHKRFEINDWYYEDPNGTGWMEYKTYCRHASFIDGGDSFDNKQFGISAGEASTFQPSTTWALEVGYEAIAQAGWTKKTLARLKADVHYGLHFLDNNINSKCDPITFGSAVGSQAGEPNRVSFCLNIMGQSLAYDTDGSSSFAALWQGHLDIMDEDKDRRAPAFALILGMLGNITPAAFANFCFRKHLTTNHRCFCFDQDAKGMVRGEGCAGIVLTELYKQVQGQPVVESTGLGTVRSVGMLQCGRGVTLTAPNGICMQETMGYACRAGMCQPDDIDAMECHAPGGLRHDAGEVVSISKVFRKKSSDLGLPVTCLKTCLGDHYAASGIVGLVRVIHSTLNATLPGSNHLRVLNPHIHDFKTPLGYSTEPLGLNSAATGLMAMNNFGNSGSYVTAICWGNVGEAAREKEDETVGPKVSPVVFWPGGGGDIDEEAIPTNGYYLVGTFNKWATPQKMTEESPGEFTGTIVLGENRWEQFQIWLDGDESRVLHPGRTKAARNNGVMGPEARNTCKLYTWQIDGRTIVAPIIVEKPTFPVAVAEKIPEYEQEYTELPNRDLGVPGHSYKVRLRVAGKYRTVDWERIASEPAKPQDEAKYYLVASWNNFAFEEMAPGSSTGSWQIEVALKRTGGEFAIVRNQDWNQKFYTVDGISNGEVYGPDDEGVGLNWVLNGSPGDVFRIDFQRQVAGGEEDVRQVSWSFLRNEVMEASEPKYFILGSWSDWNQAEEMDKKGDKWIYQFAMGPGGFECFQILLDGDWLMAFHPNIVDASPQKFHTIVGPDSQNHHLTWTIGKDADDKGFEGKIYEVQLYAAGDRPVEVTWTSDIGGAQ